VKFLPSPGAITHLRVPHGPYVRDDSAATRGADVPVHYDPMISKLVVWGEDRARALARHAARSRRISGARHRDQLAVPSPLRAPPGVPGGDYDTGFIGRNAAQLAPHAARKSWPLR